MVNTLPGKQNNPPPITDLAVMQETETSFFGFKVFVLVPRSTGQDPQEVAKGLSEHIKKLVEIATLPTLKDLAVMSAEAIPKLIKKALESEN